LVVEDATNPDSSPFWYRCSRSSWDRN
jgi:hypothetical protein